MKQMEKLIEAYKAAGAPANVISRLEEEAAARDKYTASKLPVKEAVIEDAVIVEAEPVAPVKKKTTRKKKSS
jgi:hypothetical protein